MAPEIVCGSWADFQSAGVGDEDTAVRVARDLLDSDKIIAGAHIAYDLGCLASRDPSLLPLIFKALREGRVHDLLVAQALDAIYHGVLGLDPHTRQDLRNERGVATGRYSLWNVTGLVLGRLDAKANDAWRTSYAVLRGIPIEKWPARALQYPVDDAQNTFEVARVQLIGRPGDHRWVTTEGVDQCAYCGERLTFSEQTPICAKAPWRLPHRNLANLPAQVEAAFCLYLGACWGLRTDGERVEALAGDVEEKHRRAVKRFQKFGWVRADGTEDQAAVKRSVAIAYGAAGQCVRCGGSGRVRRVKEIDCRGVKERGRYRGCMRAMAAGSIYAAACVCGGTGKIQQLGNEVTCAVDEGGCDGTGLDLRTAPMLPRADKGGVKTDRDTMMESGDDDISDYGENEFEKARTTFVPWLRGGVKGPIYPRVNVLVATGRCSYEGGPLHQMPRLGGHWDGDIYIPSIRECFRARGVWSGSPVEYVFSSTDYEAGELVTLSTFCYWVLGFSQMRDVILKTGKPGILHSDLAAQILGLSLDDFLVRLKAKDKQAVDFRQMVKPIDFGAPAGMGSVKIVLTSRKKIAGFTECEGGPVRHRDKEGYWGVRFCILAGKAKRCGEVKITSWKDRPCPPVCWKCVEAVDFILKPAFFRRFAEIKPYFKWVQRQLDTNGRLPCLAWDRDAGRPKVLRLRGLDPKRDFSAACNNGFQAMLADVMKLAWCTMVRECYLGVKDDGSTSPLGGSRMIYVAHDEPVGELLLDNSHEAALRIEEIMIWAGNVIAPGVWCAKTALARYLSKEMEPVDDPVTGRRILWEPKAKCDCDYRAEQT